jgi:hypothetical protein
MTDDQTLDDAKASAGPLHDETPKEDTEGHSIAALLAMNELGHHGSRPRDAKLEPDENLPPLTKRFPNMREEKRR